MPRQSYVQDDPSLFVCDHPGCGKGFSRKDHLLRHAANHAETSFFCPRCSRGFKRLDLLQRHEARNACEARIASNSSSTGAKTASWSASNDVIVNVGQHLSISTSSSTPYAAHPRSHPIDGLPYKRARTGSAAHSTSLISAGGPSLAGPSNQHHDAMISPTPSVSLAGRAALPDFEVDPSQFYGPAGWALAPWDPIQDSLYVNLGPPFSEPASSFGMAAWNPPTPGRVQESAERASPDAAADASMASVLKVNRDYPEFEVDLPYMVSTLAQYWLHVAPSWPFIHRGTFDINEAPSELIVMLVVAGSVHLSGKRKDYRRIVSRIRGALVQECGLDMAITTLQTFTLCHIYDTWYGTSESLFIAQCMWPIMVAHSRKKGIGVLGRTEMGEVQAEDAWTAWAKDEERRRAAFCVLLIDTQISAFWNQHPSRQLSIFAHNIPLPASKGQWEATSAAEWFQMRQAIRLPPQVGPGRGRKRRSSYLPGLHPDFEVKQVADGYSSGVLRALAAEQDLTFEMSVDGALGGMMLVIGLMAVGWDCRTRGGMGLKFKDGATNWRNLVLHGVINLRAAWETNVATVQPCHELQDMRDTFAICIISVLSDIPMLQVAAGATTVCGASIGPRQWSDAQKRLDTWVQSEHAWTCLWQSARYLRHTLLADWGVYTPWAVYLTTLVHWSFAHRLHPHEPPLPPSDHTQSAAMELLDSVLASHRRPDTMRHGVGDLISCAIERLAGSTGESDGHGSKADRDMDGDGQWVGIAQESANLLSRLLTKGMGWSGSTPAEGSSLEGTSSEVSQIDVAS